jgi:very-short-patch-repair endonuclease
VVLFPPFLKGGSRGDYLNVLPYNKRLKEIARELRSNMTEAENALWWRLRKRQLNNYLFYRQRIISNYIVGFYCPERKLVIEIDGSQHYSEPGKVKDKIRDNHLGDLGLKVLRFSAREVMENLDGVLEVINPPYPPFRKGGKLQGFLRVFF